MRSSLAACALLTGCVSLAPPLHRTAPRTADDGLAPCDLAELPTAVAIGVGPALWPEPPAGEEPPWAWTRSPEVVATFVAGIGPPELAKSLAFFGGRAICFELPGGRRRYARLCLIRGPVTGRGHVPMDFDAGFVRVHGPAWDQLARELALDR